ncbi:glutathione S-transferase [uncultured Shimia sp.]|uniref:glutathione S-transferase n=1 Tax=uncultured Shimia sp. TaxID=573152 RepID=UPI00261EF6A1|nr:glutathione S-transferase [uncultured Shimia sp.]
MTDHPILYSFRRCPYAIRARLAVASAGLTVELREVLLRDKAPEFLDTSPSASVPCLKSGQQVIDESFDIMLWALEQNDPENLLAMPSAGHDLISDTDGPFKTALDRYKYHTRYEACDRNIERSKASDHLTRLNVQLGDTIWLFGDDPRLADFAILPFVRQFAFVDKPWFDSQEWPNLHHWLEAFIDSDRFKQIMTKYPVWQADDLPTYFP